MGFGRPSLRAERSNPECVRGDSLDCFVAALLALTRIVGWPMARMRRAHHPALLRSQCWARFALPILQFRNDDSGSILAARNARALRLHRPRSERAQGMPGAGRWPACNKERGGSHHRYVATCRHSRAVVYGLYVITPAYRACQPPSPVNVASQARPQRRASVGGPGPHDFARPRKMPSSARQGALASLRPPHPRSQRT